MKPIKWITALAVSSMLLLSCSDKDEDKNPTGPGNNLKNGTMNAVISGDFSLNFQCKEAFGLQAKGDAASGTNGMMQIQGTVKQGSDEFLIDMQVYHDPATGTFDLLFPPVDGVGSVAKNKVGNFSKSGSITFTQVSTSRMKGTFSFTAFRMVAIGQEVTVTVNSGTFDVPVITVD